MSNNTREMAEGAAKVLSILRRWEESATTGLDTTNKREALIDYLDQVCRELRDVGAGHVELQEGREQLARGMAELEQGKEKLKADNKALTSRMKTLEVYSKGLEARKQEIEKTAAMQVVEKTRLEEKSKLIEEQMSSVEERLDSLKISMDDSFESITRGHGDLICKFDTLAEDQLRREQEWEEGQRLREEEGQRLREEERNEDQQRWEEDKQMIEEICEALRNDERRREEARQADGDTVASGLSQVNDSMATLAQEQLAIKEETLAMIESLADKWTIERPELEKNLLKTSKERDNALFDFSTRTFELKLSQERIDKQEKRLEELAMLREEVEMLRPKAEELDQVRAMLEEQLGQVSNDVGPIEDLDVANLISRMIKNHDKSVTERKGLKEEMERLTEQVFELRRNDMDEVKRRTDILDERSSVKRKANGVSPGTSSGSSPKRRRMDWRNRIDALSSFMSLNMPVPDPDGTVSELGAVHLILGAAADPSTLEQLSHWLDNSQEGQWYCFDQVVLQGISPDTEIDGDGCLHHSSAKQECYQIRKGARDGLERDRIFCRIR
ncbi:hypothetical protein CIB48_g10612 [Xylaria polymorpha]|nr:hypothetical protein CIB48_g10612 [Xylaria polymorpha]